MGDTSTGTFDMNSWQGLTKVLKAGRDANMDAETYAAFRDAVLRYAQGGGTDTALREEIEKMLPAFDAMVPEPAQEKPAAQPPKIKGNTKSVQKQVAPPANLPIAAAPSEEVVPESPKEEVEQEPPKQALSPEPKEVVNPPVQEPPKEEKAETPQPPTPPKEAPKPPAAPEPSIPEGPLMSADEARERIAEIKHAVTEYVGNPVTLVSENETVGRAYMQSLLAALKAVSGNAPGTLRKSMQDLEGAYKQVLEIKVGQPKAQPVEEKKPEPPKEEKIETPQPPTPPKEAPKPSEPPKEEKVEEKKPPVVEHEHTIPSLEERIQKAKEKAAQRSQVPLPKKEVLEEKKPEPPKEEKAETPQLPTLPKEEKKPPVIPEPPKKESIPEPIAPSTEKPFVTPDIEGADTKEVPKGVNDDLFAPEIEEGLAQLLKEWRIFKGEKKLFGRTPGGREHLLYQKLKDLIMFDVIAGHFEGADKDVVLSIRDYANAWRNEQGIVYAPSETFEHYLRRVIRRIIKRST